MIENKLFFLKVKKVILDKLKKKSYLNLNFSKYSLQHIKKKINFKFNLVKKSN